MNKRRLNKLAAHLETISSKKFDMQHWAINRRHDCGSTACALGYAGLMKSFRRSGLTTIFSDTGGHVQFNSPDGKTFDQQYAGQMFFNLNERQAAWLFMPWNYGKMRGPKTVAKRIRQLVTLGDIPDGVLLR